MKKLFISLLPAVLLCGGLTMDATAQSSVTSQPATSFIGWDTSKPKSSDVAVTAIIQQVVPNHASGIPAGLHVMLGTPQGVLDASVGPYLEPDIQQTLIAGKQVQVFGQVKTIHEQSYLLVRQLVVDGKVIAVRNDHGSLIRTRSQERTHTQSYSNDQNGGIQ
jgi:DNA/RNA endonuclease YhcR with UshA esterase domain